VLALDGGRTHGIIERGALEARSNSRCAGNTEGSGGGMLFGINE